MFERRRPLKVLSVSSLWRLAWICLFGAISSPSLTAQTPSDSELVVQALNYYRTGSCKEAEPLFEKILLRQPKNIAVRKLLACCLIQDKKMEEARAQFQLVLHDSPQDMEAFAGLRTATTELQSREELKQTLAIESRAVTAEPLRSSHEFKQAEERIKVRRLDEAEKILQGIVSRHPDSVRARRRLAEIYSTTRRFAKAAEIYRDLAQARKASSVYLRLLAQNLEWDGNVPEATLYYRRYLDRNPRDQMARLSLANLLMRNGHYSEATQYYRQYLEKKPDDATARLNLAHAWVWSKHYGEAVPELQRLQLQTPRDARIHLALAECYQQLSAPDLALQSYEKALELDPTNPVALEARTLLRRALDELRRQNAFAALERNDFHAAAKHFTQYLQKHPESTETMLQIARVHSWAKHY